MAIGHKDVCALTRHRDVKRWLGRYANLIPGSA
jgi:hypothetical protein